MTDETEQVPEETADGGGAVAVIDRPGAVAVPATEAEQRVELRKDRLFLPFLLPVGAILAVALFAINISRIFLAASQDSHTPALIAAIVITLGILFGATAIAAIPALRTSSLVLTVCGISAVVLLAGSVVLGAAEDKTVESAEPVAAADSKLEIDAFNFRFQAENLDAAAGVVELEYKSVEGAHTLAFEEPQFSYILLSAPGGKAVTKAEFVEGQKYTIYCTLAGHRAAGMEGTITVGAAGGAPIAGTETPTTTLAGSTVTTVPSGQTEEDPAAQSGDSTGN